MAKSRVVLETQMREHFLGPRYCHALSQSLATKEGCHFLLRRTPQNEAVSGTTATYTFLFKLPTFSECLEYEQVNSLPPRHWYILLFSGWTSVGDCPWVLLLLAENYFLSTQSKLGELTAKEPTAKSKCWQHIVMAESRFPLAVGWEGITQIMPPPISMGLLMSSLCLLFTGNTWISGPLPSLEKPRTQREGQMVLAPPAKRAIERHPFQTLLNWGWAQWASQGIIWQSSVSFTTTFSWGSWWAQTLPKQ